MSRAKYPLTIQTEEATYKRLEFIIEEIRDIVGWEVSRHRVIKWLLNRALYSSELRNILIDRKHFTI